MNDRNRSLSRLLSLLMTRGYLLVVFSLMACPLAWGQGSQQSASPQTVLAQGQKSARYRCAQRVPGRTSPYWDISQPAYFENEYFELKPDGTFFFQDYGEHITGFGEIESYYGKYEIDGDVITLKFEFFGMARRGTIEGDMIKVSMEDCDTYTKSGVLGSVVPAPKAAPGPPTESKAQVPGTTKALTNDDVIALVKAGLSETAIVTLIQKTPANFKLDAAELLRLREAGLSNAVIEAMVGSPRPALPSAPSASVAVPTAYGFYVFSQSGWQPVAPSPIVTKIGLRQRLMSGGFAVDGLTGDPPVSLDGSTAALLVYQQQVDVASLRISRLEFVPAMQASQFNMLGTRPEFFGNIYDRDYYDRVPIELWRAKGFEEIRVEPVEGKAGMYKVTFSSVPQPGRYALYSEKALHQLGYIFATESGRQGSAVYFAILPPAPSKQPGPSRDSTAPICPDYDSCLKASATAFQARRWDESLSYSEGASRLAPERGEAYVMMAGAYFERGDYNKFYEMADKGLSLGSVATAKICRERAFRPCEQGTLILSGKEVAFISTRNQKVFSAPPSQVTSRPATLYSLASAAYSWLTVAGKNYRLYLIPEAVQCQIGLALICPEPGFTQQKVFANYVHHAIQRLASGTLTKPEPPPAPATFAVVPGGTIGQFRHGTLVISGSWEVAQTPQQATHTHAGVDIAADIGTPVYALADGTVVDMIVSDRDVNFDSLGYMVIIKHTQPIEGKATYSAYFHLHEPPAVAFNQAVLGGRTQIGVVGKWGAATGPHLHLEVRHFRSRFFEHPEWNNIYGVGDQRSKPAFLENWSDPEKLGVKLY